MRDDDPDEVIRQSHSDTEDAAHQLEDVAFGARVPVLRAITAAANTAPSSTTGSVAGGAKRARVGLELTNALTSIIAEPLSFDQDGRPRSAVRLGLDLAISTVDLPAVRSGAMAQIYAVLPGKEIAEFLLGKVSQLVKDLSLLVSDSTPPSTSPRCDSQPRLRSRSADLSCSWTGTFLLSTQKPSTKSISATGRCFWMDERTSLTLCG